jgi:threonyl-tRNA synthetase
MNCPGHIQIFARPEVHRDLPLRMAERRGARHDRPARCMA